MGKKTSRSEKEFRVATIYGMLCDGKSRTSILQLASETWDVSNRTADSYIQEARVRLEQDCKITREAFMAEALAGYRSIREQAERRGQLMVAKTCLDAQTTLIGLTDNK